MGSPFVKLLCVRTINVTKRATHQFPARRLFDFHTRVGFFSFPNIAGRPGQGLGLWCGWVAGVFSSFGLHDCKSPFFVHF
jgi:hypothetical protein